MGWLFRPNTSRQVIVDDLVRFEENDHGIWETLRHSLRGNVLWCIVKWTNKKTGDVKKVITCHLLEKSGNAWGYKSIDEAMGPCYYSCPVSYFNEVPVANQQWRDKVLAHHQMKTRKLVLGDKLILADGLKVPHVVLAGIDHRLLIGRADDGSLYRVTRSQIKAVEHPPVIEAD